MAFMTDEDQQHVIQILQCENSGNIPKKVEDLYGQYQKAWSRLLQVGSLPVPILMNICIEAAPELIPSQQPGVRTASPEPVSSTEETTEDGEMAAGHPITYESPTDGVVTGRFVAKTKNGMYKVDFGDNVGVKVISPKKAHVPSLSLPDPNVVQVI